jgi:hypothetical protein
MSVTTYTITGNVLSPDGEVPSSALVRFTLRKWGEEGVNIVAPDVVDAAVDNNGAFSAKLWPGTYHVALISQINGIKRQTVLSHEATVSANADLTSII